MGQLAHEVDLGWLSLRIMQTIGLVYDLKDDLTISPKLAPIDLRAHGAVERAVKLEVGVRRIRAVVPELRVAPQPDVGRTSAPSAARRGRS